MTSLDPDATPVPGRNGMVKNELAERPALNTQLTSYFPHFDIVEQYHNVLRQNPDSTKPIAAISALISLLDAQRTQTFQETAELIQQATRKLQSAVSNPYPLQAGADLFWEYVLRSFKPPEHKTPAARRNRSAADYRQQDFNEVRDHLISNTHLFAKRAKEARLQIGELGARFITDGTTVMTHGGSRAVETMLTKAALARQTRGRMFKVVFVQSAMLKHEGDRIVSRLRKLAVPVATIPESAVSYALGGYAQSRVDRVVLGAETICKNGGIISRLGTYNIARAAKDFDVPVWVAAETHKISKANPLTPYELGVKQEIISFKTAEDFEEAKHQGSDDVAPVSSTSRDQCKVEEVNMVDYTV